MRSLAAFVSLLMLPGLTPGTARAQADDPAVQLCEAREQHLSGDPDYRSMSADIRRDRVDLTIEGGAKPTVRSCRFELTPDRKWRLAGPQTYRYIAECYAQSDKVAGLVRSGRTVAARDEARMRDCLPVLQEAFKMDAFAAAAGTLDFPGFTYPIDPARTRLQAAAHSGSGLW